MTPPLPRALHTLAASTALFALLLGVPTVLRVVAPVSLPTTIPTWDTITTGLARPLSTSTLLEVLAVAAQRRDVMTWVRGVPGEAGRGGAVEVDQVRRGVGVHDPLAGRLDHRRHRRCGGHDECFQRPKQDHGRLL